MRQRDVRTLTTLVSWYVSEFLWTKYVIQRFVEISYVEIMSEEIEYILTRLGVDIND